MNNINQTEFQSILNWSQSKPPSGESFLLIKDCIEADGNFLLYQFLQLILKDDDQFCCLTSFDQSLFHYQNVSKKMGINLDNKKFQFINGLSKLHSNSWVSDFEPLDKDDHSQIFLTINDENDLFSYYNILKNIGDNTESVCFIIDNINVLLNICTTSDVLDFINYLQTYVEEKKNGSFLIVLVHGDSQDEQKFVNSLIYRSDLLLSINGLETGYSKDIHGQLRIVSRKLRETTNIEEKQKKNIFQFTVMENTVKYIKPGQC